MLPQKIRLPESVSEAYLIILCACGIMSRPELIIIHLNLPIIQVFYSQISSLLFKNMSLLFKIKQQ